MRCVKDGRPNDTGHTDTGRARIQFVGFGCVERDELLPGVKDEGVVDRGLPVLADREKGERDRPITPPLYHRQAYRWR